MSQNCDAASIIINKPAIEVFNFMSDEHNLDLWSFGTWHINVTANGLVHGKSMHNGSSIYVRVFPHPDELLVDYAVGSDAGNLVPRIFARVIPGSVLGDSDTNCLLMLVAVRTLEMNDDRWNALIATHAVESGLIKSLIESGYDHRAPP